MFASYASLGMIGKTLEPQLNADGRCYHRCAEDATGPEAMADKRRAKIFAAAADASGRGGASPWAGANPLIASSDAMEKICARL